MNDKLVLFLKGMIIGIANAIPGVSGGTIAYVLRVYDFLLNGLSLNIKYILKNFINYLIFGSGVLLAVFGFSVLLESYLYANYPLILNLSFIGLIIGSLNFIYKQTNLKINKLSISDFVLIAVGVIVVIAPVVLTELENEVITTLTLLDAIGLFIAGILGAFAMIIPGISGSFVMLALGYYQTVITAIAEFNLLIQLPVIVGVLIGLIGGAKLVKFLLSNYSIKVYKLILGFVIGSLFAIEIVGYGLNTQSIIGTFILLIAAYLTNKFSQTKSA